MAAHYCQPFHHGGFPLFAGAEHFFLRAAHPSLHHVAGSMNTAGIAIWGVRRVGAMPILSLRILDGLNVK
jgi:hypothetical protein